MTRSTSLSVRHKQGFALVITLVMVALLTIMAVAFLFSSGTDRATGRAAVNKAKADLAAQTAVNAAVSRLVDNLSTYPDSATTWETINSNDGTILYYRTQTPEQVLPPATPPPMYVLPLMSGATPQTVANKNSALPVLTDDLPGIPGNAFNLNHRRFAGDTQGWIGAPPAASPSPAPSTSPTPPPFRGQWINLTDSDGKITGRYAYWMEDESFKANANLMGNTLRGSNTLGNAPAQIPLQGLIKAVLTNADPDTVANDTVTLRTLFPGSAFFEYRALNQVNDQPTLADAAKFEATIYSGTSNLSRSGSKRVNLNKVVIDSIDPTAIRKQLDEIIKAITYHLPNFGQRFYRNGTDRNSLDVSGTGMPSNQIIYLNKIAANIRDYVDTDSQPTIVNNDLTVNIGGIPTHSIPAGGSGPNEVVAIGKEAVPLIQEYMVRVKQIEPKLRSVATANYHIEIDHEVEFWNMTNKDISIASLGSNPFLRIANQFAWTSYGGVDILVDPSRDFSIPLTSFRNASGASLVFAAGTATVLTTDPTDLPTTFTGVNAARVFRPPAGTPPDPSRVYTGTCNRKTASSHPHLDAQTRPTASSTASDLETEIILGNDTGVLESFGAPAVYYITVNADDGTLTTNTERIDTTKWYFRASGLKGNVGTPFAPPTPSQTGDPRTNNEQLSITNSVANDDQTAYKLEIYTAVPPFDSASFTALNSRFVNPALWTDPANNTADASHAPAIVANRALTSIGQLGDIFDPARVVGSASPAGSADIRYSRGGGRTLKIGQPDDLWDGSSTSASREWTAWRLTDILTSSDSTQLDGRININGVNRDAGVAFKAALDGYNFQAPPDSDPTIASQALTDTQVNSLVSQMQARVTNQSPFTQTTGPFAERGELSEMPVFNSGTQLTGRDMASIYDKGREELFKRLVELITTRGNIFTVYAVGQSLIQREGAASPIVTSTSQIKVTFRIDPVWNAGTPSDPFDPTIAARFQKPDKYAIKILYAGE